MTFSGKVLTVMGGSGYIGSNVSKTAVEMGCKVICI